MMRHWNTIASTLLRAYRYFRSHWQVSRSVHAGDLRRTAIKVGQNEPCPCVSGKKYKCCGGATVN